MKKLLVIGVAFATILTSCNSEGGKTGSAVIETQSDSLSNALGISMGGQIKELLGNEELNTQVLVAAFDKVMKSENIADLATDRQAADNFIRNYLSVVLPAKKLDAGNDFLAKEENKANIMKTESGLLYEVQEAGDMSLKPVAADTVVVNYKGTLINGTEFDSSYKRGEPATFPLNRVIPGWTEGLQLVGKGGKIRLVIPSNLAYGTNGQLANEVLIFEVEVLDVKKTATK